MPTFDDSFPAIIVALAERYGGDLGPGDLGDPFASLIAVLLGRSLDHRKCLRARDALRDAGLLEPRALAEAESVEVGEAFRSSGLAVPSRVLSSLRKLARWIVDDHQGSADRLQDESISTERLRGELSALNGIGRATADVLLLFGLRRAVYPVDRASYRIMVRHGWIDPTADYEEAQSVVERQATDTPATFAHLSAGMERVGRDFCRVRSPRCEECPLRPWLPDGGPINPAFVED